MKHQNILVSNDNLKRILLKQRLDTSKLKKISPIQSCIMHFHSNVTYIMMLLNK